MPLSYSGDDTSTQAPSPLPAKNATPIASLPVDGETLNVASVYQAFKMLADAIDAFFDRGGWIDAANTWSAAQTFGSISFTNNTGALFCAGDSGVTATPQSFSIARSYLGWNTAGGAKTTNLPDLGTVPSGALFFAIIKDESGNAGANNITINAFAGQTIDGSASATISTNYGVVRLLGTGATSSWHVI